MPRTVLVPLPLDPAGQPETTRITVALTDVAGWPLSGAIAEDGTPLVGDTVRVYPTVAQQAALDAGTPPADIAPDALVLYAQAEIVLPPGCSGSYYRIVVEALWGARHEYQRQLVADSTPLPWADWIFGAAAPPVPPAGDSYMRSLIYDPRGIAADTFDLAHLTGALDGGVF